MTLPEVPSTPPAIAIPRFPLTASASLASTLGKPVLSGRRADGDVRTVVRLHPLSHARDRPTAAMSELVITSSTTTCR